MFLKILLYQKLLPVKNLGGGAFAPLPDAGYGPANVPETVLAVPSPGWAFLAL